jgi:prefoldin subunit 5
MDDLEQRCHDLDAKARRIEEERDVVMMENDELHDRLNTFAAMRANMTAEEARSDEEFKEDLSRLNEEVQRLEGSVGYLQDNLLAMGDKVKDVAVLKDTVKVS